MVGRTQALCYLRAPPVTFWLTFAPMVPERRCCLSRRKFATDVSVRVCRHNRLLAGIWSSAVAGEICGWDCSAYSIRMTRKLASRSIHRHSIIGARQAREIADCAVTISLQLVLVVVELLLACAIGFATRLSLVQSCMISMGGVPLPEWQSWTETSAVHCGFEQEPS